jgi:L-threonylcarbamoyladenylate synthase
VLERTKVLTTDTPALFEAAVREATNLLQTGQVVALPTETVYGLAANALDPSAVKRIFEIKGRPAHNPIIVHVADVAMARECVSDWAPMAEKLARAFWPGPLTLVLPRAKAIPELVTAGGATVGVRWPSHPFIQAVIRECRFPLAAPSANLAGRVSPTSAEHVRKDLGGKIPLIIDGGQCQIGIESTVIDLSVHSPRLLRPGMIHEESLVSVLGEIASSHSAFSTLHSPLKSPGLLLKHYAPKAKLVVLSWNDDAELKIKLSETFDSQLSTLNSQLSGVHILAHTRIPSPESFASVSVIPHDPEAFARALYAELHRADEAKAQCIVIEAVPDTVEWRAIADRLRRASAE